MMDITNWGWDLTWCMFCVSAHQTLTQSETCVQAKCFQVFPSSHNICIEQHELSAGRGKCPRVQAATGFACMFHVPLEQRGQQFFVFVSGLPQLPARDQANILIKFAFYKWSTSVTKSCEIC